jgi:hypothetical protein
MDLGDDSVNGVLCRFGYMLMADPAAALRQVRERADGFGPDEGSTCPGSA